MRWIATVVIAGSLFMGSAALAGEKIKLPTGSVSAKPKVSTAIERGTMQHARTPVTSVDWTRRAVGNGGSGGGYAPYYSYRPYFSTYTPSYVGYYTRPYYGYSYYSPSWVYRDAWGPGMAFGVAPMTYGGGGWYW